MLTVLLSLSNVDLSLPSGRKMVDEKLSLRPVATTTFVYNCEVCLPG